MFKNLHGFHLCDKCRIIIEYTDNSQKVTTIKTARNKELHFCSDKCRIVYLRGKAYWNRKLRYMEKNRSESCCGSCPL